MEHLKEIKDVIDYLDSKPSDIDFDQVRNVLGTAYELAHQGLELSNDAGKYRQAKKDLDLLKSDYDLLFENHNLIKIANQDLEKQLNEISPLISHIKDQLVGKINLIKFYSSEKRQDLIEQISNANPSNVTSLKISIESDFNAEWCKKEETLQGDHNFINISNYKKGA